MRAHNGFDVADVPPRRTQPGASAFVIVSAGALKILLGGPPTGSGFLFLLDLFFSLFFLVSFTLDATH